MLQAPNFDKVKQRIEQIAKNIEEETDDTMERVGKKIKTEQELLIPVGMTADLKRGQRMAINNYGTSTELLFWNIEPYAGYVEFGTGVKGSGTATVIPKNIALTYKSEGWVYYNEDLEQFLYTEGMPARQFFFPPIRNNEKLLQREIRKAIERAMKK